MKFIDNLLIAIAIAFLIFAGLFYVNAQQSDLTCKQYYEMTGDVDHEVCS